MYVSLYQYQYVVVPDLTDESKSLHEAYKFKYSSSPFDDGTILSGNTLIDKRKGVAMPKTTKPLAEIVFWWSN